MTRTTQHELEARVVNFNRRMSAGVELRLESRNGYKCLDEFHGETAIRCVVCGTAGAISDWLFVGMQAIDLAKTKLEERVA